LPAIFRGFMPFIMIQLVVLALVLLVPKSRWCLRRGKERDRRHGLL
jgi:TRAP-type mannitol/chloroaromatic compound transport system permease large subunit